MGFNFGFGFLGSMGEPLAKRARRRKRRMFEEDKSRIIRFGVSIRPA